MHYDNDIYLEHLFCHFVNVFIFIFITLHFQHKILLIMSQINTKLLLIPTEFVYINLFDRISYLFSILRQYISHSFVTVFQNDNRNLTPKLICFYCVLTMTMTIFHQHYSYYKFIDFLVFNVFTVPTSAIFDYLQSGKKRCHKIYFHQNI